MEGTRRPIGTVTSALPSLVKLADIWEASLVQRCIKVVAQLGIADLLADGDLGLDDLAQRTGAHAPTLYRVLRLLCAHGIFSETATSRFTLTPAAECLRSDVPWSLRWCSAMLDCHDKAGSELLHAVRTGDNPFEKATGGSLWTYLADDPDAGGWFDREMEARNHTLNIPALLARDWTGASTVVDVAGGTGQALSSLLRANRHLRGILVDQPQVIERARAVVRAAGVEGRCDLVPADIFTAVPSGGDTYLLARVVHDWDDEHALQILRVIRRAMSAGGRLLILEVIVPPPGNAPHRSKAMDISMLLLFGGGRERTVAEYRELLEKAGFRLAGVARGLGTANIIEATPE